MLANSMLPTHDEPNQEAHHRDPFYPRFWPERLHEPRHRKKPSGIFVCSMGELFGPWLPPEWTGMVLEQIRMSPQHRFYVLTKQTQELKRWSPFPPNCWVGASVTNPDGFVAAVIGLAAVEAPVKFISFEPLLARVASPADISGRLRFAGIRWAILGAQTNPAVIPRPEWVEEIINACGKAQIPVYLTDSLRPIYPQLRREMPIRSVNDD